MQNSSRLLTVNSDILYIYNKLTKKPSKNRPAGGMHPPDPPAKIAPAQLILSLRHCPSSPTASNYPVVYVFPLQSWINKLYCLLADYHKKFTLWSCKEMVIKADIWQFICFYYGDNSSLFLAYNQFFKRSATILESFWGNTCNFRHLPSSSNLPNVHNISL